MIMAEEKVQGFTALTDNGVACLCRMSRQPAPGAGPLWLGARAAGGGTSAVSPRFRQATVEAAISFDEFNF